MIRHRFSLALLLLACAVPGCFAQENNPAKMQAFREEFLAQFPWTDLCTTREDAQFLRIMVASARAQRGVEIGSFTGYGAIHMGMAFERNGGHLFTMEIDPDTARQCRENIKKVGLEKTVTVMEGDALKLIPTLEGQFDFVFIDAKKSDYYKYFLALKPMLKAGAVIVADNVIVSANDMKDFLDAMRTDPDYDMVIIRCTDQKKDGMAVICKIK
ncbi:MAG TPA: class I SAM-dependent methyltransferase [bacterium]|nr:class I SAM-dependent methyltransferase [bacterium]